MKEVDINELKVIQLQILDVVNSFCSTNGIKFWLDSGTLLGAIRHNGYIPWDDDIDIGMLREDFDRFISVFNNENSQYKVVCNELNYDCVYPYAKVLDMDTVLYEPNEKNGVKLNINIDLFVYDSTPGGRKTKKQYNCRDMYAFFNSVQYNLYPTKTWYKKAPKAALRELLRLFPKGFFSRKVVQNSKRYNHLENKYVGNFTSLSRVLCEKTIFDSTILWKFEGSSYPVPVGYDIWLKAFYGDYMQLPPLEKRVSHHIFKAYTR